MTRWQNGERRSKAANICLGGESVGKKKLKSSDIQKTISAEAVSQGMRSRMH